MWQIILFSSWETCKIPWFFCNAGEWCMWGALWLKSVLKATVLPKNKRTATGTLYCYLQHHKQNLSAQLHSDCHSLGDKAQQQKCEGSSRLFWGRVKKQPVLSSFASAKLRGWQTLRNSYCLSLVLKMTTLQMWESNFLHTLISKRRGCVIHHQSLTKLTKKNKETSKPKPNHNNILKHSAIPSPPQKTLTDNPTQPTQPPREDHACYLWNAKGWRALALVSLRSDCWSKWGLVQSVKYGANSATSSQVD